jgi:hypothetical protein
MIPAIAQETITIDNVKLYTADGEYKEILIPRSTPTLDGFMKFLEKQLKEEPQIKNNNWITYPNLHPIDDNCIDSTETNKYIYETDGNDVEVYK